MLKPQKQLTFKILIISFLGLFMLAPITMVKGKIAERKNFQFQAETDVAASGTGRQMLITPFLVIPYSVTRETSNQPQQKGVYQSIDFQKQILPESLKGIFSVTNTILNKGIYKIPIYQSELDLQLNLSLESIQNSIRNIQGQKGFDAFGVPFISLHISDMRGIENTPMVTVNGISQSLKPGSGLNQLNSGIRVEVPSLMELTKDLNIQVQVKLRGMSSISWIPMANDAEIVVTSDWPHPRFYGAALPTKRAIESSGFKASWQSTRFSSNFSTLVKQCQEQSNCFSLTNKSRGVEFIDPVDEYLQSERSLKYAMLFIGLSFITFFIFETVKGQPIHPIQYGFVGLAIAVFYLLLISLAEHIQFGLAYAIGASSCSLLLLFYVRYLFKRLLAAIIFTAMLLALYGLLYVIVQAEDFALLMGSILVFFVLAAMMIVTRKIDWYTIVPTKASE